MKKILSIQSAVTLGFVGNTVAAPVLIAMGHHPLIVDTIKLAAHPGYGQKRGGVPNQADFVAILDALEGFGALAEIDLLVTGYLGAPEQIAPIAQTITRWRAHAPSGPYILDPVIGDAGTLYVAAKTASSIREHLLPLATITTPNRFELEILADTKICDADSACVAADRLLAENPMLQAVIATAVGRTKDNDSQSAPVSIGDLLVTRGDGPLWLNTFYDGQNTVKNLPGGGDLLTALLVGHLANGTELPAAVKAASRTAQMVIAKSQGTRDLALLDQLSALLS